MGIRENMKKILARSIVTPFRLASASVRLFYFLAWLDVFFSSLSFHIFSELSPLSRTRRVWQGNFHELRNKEVAMRNEKSCSKPEAAKFLVTREETVGPGEKRGRSGSNSEKARTKTKRVQEWHANESFLEMILLYFTKSVKFITVRENIFIPDFLTTHSFFLELFKFIFFYTNFWQRSVRRYFLMSEPNLIIL